MDVITESIIRKIPRDMRITSRSAMYIKYLMDHHKIVIDDMEPDEDDDINYFHKWFFRVYKYKPFIINGKPYLISRFN